MGLRAMAEDRSDRVTRAAYAEVARSTVDIPQARDTPAIAANEKRGLS